MQIEEQDVLHKYAPELLEQLSSGIDLLDYEHSGSKNIIGIFKQQGQPGLLVPKKFGGLGASTLDLCKILRLVGSKCPSMSIAMTMHHHSVAAFVAGSIPMSCSDDLLIKIGEGHLLSSAFSEAKPGSDILHATVNVEIDESFEFAYVSGQKKPVSMSHFSDYVLANVSLDGTRSNRGLVLIDKSLAGVDVEKFWNNPYLKSADSNCLIFDCVKIPVECILVPNINANSDLQNSVRFDIADAEIAISNFFQVMKCSAYLGMVTRLCELTIGSKSCGSNSRLNILSKLESSVMSVYYLAGLLDETKYFTHLLAKAMLVSHEVMNQLDVIVAECCCNLGGNEYLNNEEVLYLCTVSKCIKFHPPSKDYKEQIIDNTY